MKRREFIRSCGVIIVGTSTGAAVLQSCDTIYYAQATKSNDDLIIPLSDFERKKNDKTSQRKFVLVKKDDQPFPICVYNIKGTYYASLLKCTHRGCELNVGGGVYSCPCHGSEFSIKGEVLEGPANENLQMYKTEIKDDKIYVQL